MTIPYQANESAAGADASVEAPNLYDMKLLDLATLVQKVGNDRMIVAKKDTKSSKSINKWLHDTAKQSDGQGPF